MNPKKKIRILQFPLAASKGGVTQYVLNLWKNIDRKIIQFDFITFSPYLDFENELLKEGCKVYHMSCYPETNEEQFAAEFGAVLNRGYDVIELHTGHWKNTIMEEMAKRQGGCKVIVHAHGTGIVADLSWQEMVKAKERHYQIRDTIDEKLADDFWACSKDAADWLYGVKIPRDKITIINNTIETSLFKYNEEIRICKRHQFKLTDKYVIGHVGRFEEEKNHKFILDVFARLHKKYSQSFLLLVGDGSCREKIEKKIVEYGIEDSVLLTGKKEDVSGYLQVMDTFVFPSFFEGFGLALLEAQCSGLQCIGSTNVPEEAFITKYAQRVSLDEPDKWVEILEKIAKGYNRQSQDMIIKSKGYDTTIQVRKLEKMYME